MSTTIIRQNQVFKKSDGNYTSEASTCRFPVGVWPKDIQFQADARTSDVVLLKQGEIKHACDQEVIFVVYESDDKKTKLKIFND